MTQNNDTRLVERLATMADDLGLAIEYAGIGEVQAECGTAKARIESLTAALEPLAQIARDIANIEQQVGDMPSPDHMLRLVPMRLLRDAAATLESTK